MSDATNPGAPLGQEFETLLRQAREGDSAALGRLLDGFRFLLLAEANDQLPADLRGKEGPSDLVQQTFLEAHRDFGQFRGDGEAELRRWLLGILRHNGANLRRKYYDTEKSCVGREEPIGDGPAGQAPGHTPSPSSLASRQEEEELLRQALARLPELDREVIRLHHEQRCPFRDVANQLGLPSAEAARKRFARAVEALAGAVAALRGEAAGGDPPPEPEAGRGTPKA